MNQTPHCCVDCEGTPDGGKTCPNARELLPAPLPTSKAMEKAIKMVGGALESLHHNHEGVPAAEAKRMAAVALGKVCSAVEQARREEREKYEAYPKRPVPDCFDSPADELDYWRSEALALDSWHVIQNKRAEAFALLVAAVREWQEARRLARYPQDEGAENRRRAERLYAAEDALAALPLPEVTP